MATMHNDDRITLLGILTQLTPLQDAEGLRTLLRTMGLGSLIPSLLLSGSSITMVGGTLHALEQYGHTASGQDALAILYSVLQQDFFGASPTQKQALATIAERYQYPVEIPRAPSQPWKGVPSASYYQEQIFHENTLHPIAFLEEALQRARAVGYVLITTKTSLSQGTGFLISPNLLLTNQHVLSDASLLPGTSVKFNYQLDSTGKELPTDVVPVQVGGVYHANPQLDYAVVELAGRPGDRWGWVTLAQQLPQAEERIYIIQHPDGRPKQISFEYNRLAYVDANNVQYVTSTMSGSSGSPVFNRGWEVVALHKGWGLALPSPNAGQVARNEGTPMTAILADLPAKIRQQLPHS